MKLLLLLIPWLLFAIEPASPKLTQSKQFPFPTKITQKSGTVSLFCNIDTTGNIEKSMILASSNPAFEKVVPELLKTVNFTPATYNKQPVPIRIYLDLMFTKGKETKILITRVRKDKRYQKAVAALEEIEAKKAEAAIKKSATPQTDATKKPGDKGSEAAAKTPEPKKKPVAPTLSKLPKLIKFIPPNYPPELFKQEIDGVVTALIDIDATGKISKVIPTAATRKEFIAPAVEAMKQFIFSPGEFQNKPVPVRITYQYYFKVKDQKQASKEELDRAKKRKEIIREEQDYDSLKGKLISYGDREPVANTIVNVVQGESQYEAYTDKNGLFLFQNLPDGEYTVIVPKNNNFLQYETKESVKKGTVISLSIYLPRANINPYELTVISSKGKKEVTKQVIKIEELLKVPGSGGDAIKVVQNLPGVARPGGLSGQIIIRGSDNRESQKYIDGFELPIIYHFGGIASVYNSEMLANVAYYPGGYSARFGRAIGGIINVETRQAKTEKESKNMHGYLDIDLIDTSALIEVPIDEDSGVAVAFRRSYIDAVLPFFLPDDVADIVVALPVYYDWQLQYNNRITKKDTITFNFFGSQDSLELYFGKPQGDANIAGDFGFEIFASTVKTSWIHKFGRKQENTLSLGVQYSSRDFALGELIKFQLDVWNFVLKDDFSWRTNKYFTFNAGVDLKTSVYHADITVPNFGLGGGNSDDFRPIGSYDLIHEEQDGTAFTPAVYLEGVLTFGALKIIPGLRFDYASNTEELTIDGRFATFYNITPKWLIKGSVGSFHQAPGVDQTDSKLGNPDLNAQYSLQYIVGTEYNLTDYLTGSIEFFYTDQQKLFVSGKEDIGEASLTNKGKGRSYGMELFIRHNLSKRFFGWISYTLMKAERKEHPTEDWELFQYDQTHIITALGSYKLPWGLTFGARVRYVTGSPETPVIGSIYDADNDAYTALYGKANSVRNDPFFQLDLRVDKLWQFKYWSLTAYLDVQNVTYYDNQEGVNYNFDYSENQKVTGLPIFPSFGIKGAF